jgi:hypothetical protein
MAAARSLRIFAQRLGEIFARAGTIRSSLCRISARSIGMAAGGWSLSLANRVTAERRSRFRPGVSSGLAARRSSTVCSVTAVVIGGMRSIFIGFFSRRGPAMSGSGLQRTGGAIREDI